MKNHDNDFLFTFIFKSIYIIHMKKVCASCIGLNVTKIIKTDNELLPEWLQTTDYVSKFINGQTNFKQIKIKKFDTKLEVNLGTSRSGKYVLYCGAESSISPKIKNAKQAYGNFKNNGIAKVNSNGIATLYFNCPQPYSTTVKDKRLKETFYRHVHFCLSNKLNNNWLSTVYTKIIVCHVSLKNTINKVKRGTAVLINSLPGTMYGKSHIPNSYNLPHTKLKRMSQNDLIKWFSDVIKMNYPKLHNIIKEGNLNIYEVPIIVYCAHSGCESSNIAAIELLKKGFVNISEFKGGMKEYVAYKKKVC